MSSNTGIEWSQHPITGKGHTLNTVTGCALKGRTDCLNCYAMKMAHRLQAMGLEQYQDTTVLTEKGPLWTGTTHFAEHMLERPRSWRDPAFVFVNSMADLFHSTVLDEWIFKTWEVMVEVDRHVYIVLTKQPERAVQLASQLDWPDHIWFGTSVGHPQYIERVDHLQKLPARTKVVSVEPMIGPVRLGDRLYHRIVCDSPDCDSERVYQTEEEFEAKGRMWVGCGCPRCVLRRSKESRARRQDKNAPRTIEGKYRHVPPIRWVLGGGESGPGARMMPLNWEHALWKECVTAGVDYFLKQLGTVAAQRLGLQSSKGSDPEEWPESILKREHTLRSFPPLPPSTIPPGTVQPLL